MKSKQLDSTDQRILQELKQNCRRSYRELAASTGISPATIIERIKRMEKEGVITGYSANFDYLKLGYEFMAIVQISIHGDLLKIQEKIAKLKGVAAVYDTTGQYDSTAVLICKNRSELSALVKKILNIPGVEKTNTNMVLNVVKRIVDFAQV